MENTPSTPQAEDFTPVLPPSPQVEKPIKKPWSKRMVFLVLLFSFLFLTGGILVINNVFFPPSKPIPTQTDNKTKIPHATFTPSHTSQTQGIYKNTIYKFSFAYPKGLTPKETTYGLGVTNVAFNNTKTKEEGVYQILIFSKTVAGMIGQNFDIYFKMENNTTSTIKDADGNPQNFTKIKNRTIGTLRAFDYKSMPQNPDPTDEAEVGTYIELGDTIIIISTGESMRQDLDKILKTFTYPSKS